MAHKLIKLHHGIQSQTQNLDWLIKEYSMERKSAGLFNKQTADRLYRESIEIAKGLNLNLDNLNLFKKVLKTVRADSPSIFNFGKKLGSLFLESDAAFKKLASELVEKRQGKWLPMIIVENEAEFKYPESLDALKFEKTILLNHTRYPQLSGSEKNEKSQEPGFVKEKEFRVTRLDKYSGLLAKIINLGISDSSQIPEKKTVKESVSEIPEYLRYQPKEFKT